MAKITYTDKVAINIDPTIPDINKCKADDLNEIKNVVNENENKTLIAISSTAPSQCTTGDLYFNTTSKKIFTATATDTWSSTGEDPTENTLYLYDNTIYSYDGTTLVAVGGGTEIAISTTQPSGDEILWINPEEVVPISSLNLGNFYLDPLWTTTTSDIITSGTNDNITIPNLTQYNDIVIEYQFHGKKYYKLVHKPGSTTNYFVNLDGQAVDIGEETSATERLISHYWGTRSILVQNTTNKIKDLPVKTNSYLGYEYINDSEVGYANQMSSSLYNTFWNKDGVYTSANIDKNIVIIGVYAVMVGGN